MNAFPKHLTIGFTALSLLLLAACKSPDNSSARAALGLKQARDQVVVAYQELDETTQSLDQMVYSPGSDLNAQFEQFDTNLSQLMNIADEVRSASLAMQVRGESYFQSWGQELSQMNSEAIREVSTDRRDEVYSKFSQTARLYRVANQELTGYVARLSDIRSHLSTDLTMAGIEAIRPQVEELDDDTSEVRDALAAVVDSFQRMGAMPPQKQGMATSDME